MIVIGLAMLLFGAQRLPDAARSLGHSARILKAEISGDDRPPARPTVSEGVRAAGFAQPGSSDRGNS
jgi:sec-independent protein translocase protein TatA